MTAARAQLAIATRQPAGNDWTMWISADEAAERFGCALRTMRHKCSTELMARGLAKCCPGPEGGKARWWVHRDHDIRLAGGVLGVAHVVPKAELDRYTTKQVRVMHVRRDCVERLRTRRTAEHRPQRDWMPQLVGELQFIHREVEGFKISERSLRRWDALYRNPADLVKLVDERGGDQKSKGDPAAWHHFLALYMHQNKLKISTAWRMTRDEARVQEWAWCSYRSCVRQLDNRVSPDEQLKVREPAKWRSRNAPYLEQDREKYAANECWVADHSQLDVFCRWRDTYVRPVVTTFQDWRTRRIMGWTMSVTPDSTSIASALHHGLYESQGAWGPPREVCLDNGKDFKAYTFNGQKKDWKLKKMIQAGYCDEATFGGIYGILGIKTRFALPYNPNGKPRQEKFYGRVHERFCKMFESYTGSTPDQKPERLPHVLKLGSQVPTYEEVFGRFTNFVEGFNADAEHTIDDLADPGTGVKLSPDKALEQWIETVRVYLDQGVLDEIRQHYHQPVAVGRNGVRVVIRGVPIRYGQFSEELRRYKSAGRKKDERRPKVIVAYNPHDLRSVRVRDLDGRLICVAPANRIGGATDAVSLDQLKEELARQRRYAKAKEVVRKTPLRIAALSTEERLARSVAGDKPRPEPSVLQPIQTPLDGQSKEVRRQLDRVAAGAEGMSNLGLAQRGAATPTKPPTRKYQITLPDAATISEGGRS